MSHIRPASAKGLLVVEAGLAALGVLVHHGLLAEYGDITDSTLEAFISGFTAGVGVVALVLVGACGLAALALAQRPWMRLSAAAIPLLMLLGMLAVTPVALSQKLEQQYDATPQCVSTPDDGSTEGPGIRAQQDSQEAFESIRHVGLFGGGGGSGMGGCDRTFTLTEDIDVLQHYRTALPEAGWQVVEDEGDHLRAERGDMAFEVAVCDRGGIVWAGRSDIRGIARCDRDDTVVELP